MKLNASYHQERLWFIDKFETANIYKAEPVYHNIPLILCCKGQMDEALLKKSINFTIQKHESLRTTIITENEQPLQRVKDHVEIELEIIERCSDNFDTNNKDHIAQILSHSLVPFHLYQNLVAAKVFRFKQNINILLVTIHHIIVDRYSVGIIAQEILEYYKSLLTNDYLEIHDMPFQYADFTIWQRELNAENWEPFLFYWKRQLAGQLQILDLPGDFPRAPVHYFQPGLEKLIIKGEPYQQIKSYSAKHDINPENIFLAAFLLLLHRYSGLREINIGLMMPNRKQPDTQNIVGPFSNLVVIRLNLKENWTQEQFLTHLKQVLHEADTHQELPFEKLVLALDPEPDMSRTALFDVLFSFENSVQLPDLEGIDVVRVETNYGLGKYDINLLIQHQNHHFAGSLVYNKCIFTGQTVERLTRHFETLLASLVMESTQSLYNLQMLQKQETDQILDSWNQTQVNYPKQLTIVDLFTDQAQRTPDKICIQHKNIQLSYHALHEASDQLAHYLIADCNINPGDYVAICVDKSEWMIISILAILKAGAAYVPMDPTYPRLRIQSIIQNCGCRHMIVDQQISLENNISLIDLRQLQLDNSGQGELKIHITSDHPAYIIHTSGSTGKAKGCLLTHRNVVRLIKNERHDFDFHEQDVWIMAHSLCFDFSVWEIWGALLYGAKLIIPERTDTQDPALLLRLVKKHHVSILNQTPDAFYQFMEAEMQTDCHDLTNHLRYIIFGGAKLNPGRLEKWIHFYPLQQIKLINMYGITETTVHVTFYKLKERDINHKHPISIIGRPLPETQLYILDDFNNLCPIGVWGEIYVGGTGLATEYVNQPQLTREKFITHPFKHSERIYKTGDIGRWLSDGNVEFSGRRDGQVKIRGFRVETEEIAFYMQQHSEIEETVVTTYHNARMKQIELVAYFVEKKSSERVDLTAVKLRNYLSNYLPTYMIPSYFIPIDKVPLTISGKINKSALPSPDSYRIKGDRVCRAPETENEKLLARIWEEFLSIKKIGVTDNFFDLGGHSLKAAQIVAAINKKVSKQIKLSDIFLYPTIAELVKLIDSQIGPDPADIPVAALQESYDVSPAQQSIWLHEQLDHEKNIYNVPAAFIFRGNLNVQSLQKAFSTIIDRHEILRTYFILQNRVLKQKIVDSIPVKIQPHDFSGRNQKDELAQNYIKKEATRPFNLSIAPLFRLSLLKMKSDEYIFIFITHHIISDGWSINILQKELEDRYNSHVKGFEKSNEELRIHYKDYTIWYKNFLQGPGSEYLREYWHQKLALPISTLRFPSVEQISETNGFAGDSASFVLDKTLVAQLNQLALQHSCSLFMVLMTYVKILLYYYTGEKDLTVGTPAACRYHPSLENQLGCFINMLPLRDTMDDKKTFLDMLHQVKQTVLDAFDHQVYPCDYLIDELNLTKNGQQHPLFNVMVVLQNNEQKELALQGLEITRLSIEKKKTLFSLVFEFREFDDTIGLNIAYQLDPFNKSRIRRLWSHFMTLLKESFINPTQPINKLRVLPTSEFDTLMGFAYGDWNEKSSNIKGNICEAFSKSVEKYREYHAISFNEESLSYHQLNEQADMLASILINTYKIQEEDVIGLFFKPCLEIIIAIMGTLKAHAVFLPIDPEWPDKRFDYIIQDSQCKMILTDKNLFKVIRNTYSLPVLIVNRSDTREKASHSNRPGQKHDRLAYIMYTSGSTGTPKGVMIEHHSVLNMVKGYQSTIYSQYTHRLRVACLSSFVFDASIQQIFTALLLGYELYIVPNDVRKDPFALIKFLRLKSIELIDATPSLFSMLMVSNHNQPFTPYLRHILIGGEVLTSALLDKFYDNALNRDIRITNVYGPTEATVDACYFDCEVENKRKNIPIGKPLPNVRIYILNQHLKLSPLGDIGELYIAGKGLARGYLKQTRLTAQHFIESPFHPEERIFKTGDQGRWLEDGLIEFWGRYDRQIKLRGHRIELGEIENKLLDIPGIHEATVNIVGEEGNKNICAYVVCSSTLDLKQLKSYLSDYLPFSMIPNYFVKMDKIPLNSSGKVDFKALPLPKNQHDISRTFIPNKTEKKLIKIWASILAMEEKSIDVGKTFFELGGNSINAINIIVEIYDELKVSITLSDFYQYADIRSLALHVDRKRKEGESYLKTPHKDTVLALSFQQKRICFLWQKNPNSTDYHVPESIFFEEEVDKAAIKFALQELIKRHQMLRTRLVYVDNQYMQEILPQVNLPLTLVDVSQGDTELKRRSIITDKLLKPFKLTDIPLFRFILLRLSSKRYELLYNFHHIIIDGWAVEILKKEFFLHYHHYRNKKRSSLEPVVYDYGYFIEWQIQSLKNSTLIDQATQFWQGKFTEAIPIVNLPKSIIAVDKDNEGVGRGWKVGPDLKESLVILAKSLNTTMFTVMFSTFLQILRRFFEGNPVGCYIISAGRDRFEFMETVGVFINPLLCSVSLDRNSSFQQTIQDLHVEIQQIVQMQTYPMELILDQLALNNISVPFAFNMLNLQNLSQTVKLESFENYLLEDVPDAKFAIEIYVKEYTNGVEIFWSFQKKYFDQKMMSYLGEAYLRLLEFVCKYPQKSYDQFMQKKKKVIFKPPSKTG